MSSDVPAAEIAFLERKFGRPPIVDLVFDVTLRNARPAPRWFLLPATLGAAALPIGTAGVNAVETYELPGDGKVVLGRFLGNAGFQALYLPANADVTVRRFPISSWEEAPVDSVEIDVVVARGFTVDGEPAASWFGVDPISDRHADVAGENPVLLSSRHMPDLRSMGVSIAEDERMGLRVDLTAR